MEEIKKFLLAISKDQKVKDMMKGSEEPKTMEEASELYYGIAQKLGCKFSKEELLETMKKVENAKKITAEKVKEKVKKALEEADLNVVAGGVCTNTVDADPIHSACQDTFNYGEWCWMSDSCSMVINDYSDAKGAYETDPSIDCNSEMMSVTDDSPYGSDYEIWGVTCKGGMDDF